MFRIIFSFLVFVALFSSIVMAEKGHAQNFPRDELRQALRLTKSKVKVTQVINGDTFVVNNKETVHLPGIYIPVENHNSAGQHQQAAKDFLQESLLDKFVSLYQVRDPARGQQNALGHTEAYVMREDGMFVQEEMIKRGLAFYYPSQSHYELSGKFYEAEEAARAGKSGLWSDSEWRIVAADDIQNIKKDRFSIVQGKIASVATRNNVIYLNFSRNWRDDFTVGIETPLRREFSKFGINLLQLSNRVVRVRGWVRDYNGPYMELFHPSQMEILANDAVVKQDGQNVPAEAPKMDSILEDTIKERVMPNSAMFPNPTLEDLSLPGDNWNE